MKEYGPVVKNFLKYIGYDTQSNPNSKTFPSTEKQLVLLNELVKEMKEIGIEDASIDSYGYVTGTVKSNIDRKVPVVGFLAHVDTHSDASGKNIKAQIVENYDGQDIILNQKKNIILHTDIFPDILSYIGQDIITTDGTTLLGADDKAGVAEIMAAAQYLIEHPEIEHGDIRIGFSPDEEVAQGMKYFNVKKFGAEYAYTMDGSKIGSFSYENFNAATAKIKIVGINVHPGQSKGKMHSALLLGQEFNSMLPVHERPESTELKEGFYHLLHMEGTPTEVNMTYILRDHDLEKYAERKKVLQKTADFIKCKYREKISIHVEIEDSYFNMVEKILPHKNVLIDTVLSSMEEVNIKPIVTPTRGGTDGARLSFMGLPCPDIFEGGHNYHGVYEYIPIYSMEKAVELIVKISENYGKIRERD